VPHTNVNVIQVTRVTDFSARHSTNAVKAHVTTTPTVSTIRKLTSQHAFAGLVLRAVARGVTVTTLTNVKLVKQNVPTSPPVATRLGRTNAIVHKDILEMVASALMWTSVSLELMTVKHGLSVPTMMVVSHASAKTGLP
jgi:hypothetical protein